MYVHVGYIDMQNNIQMIGGPLCCCFLSTSYLYELTLTTVMQILLLIKYTQH